jgi:uncharacterized protein YabE (DUF348 family)
VRWGAKRPRNTYSIVFLIAILSFVLTSGQFPPAPSASAESARLVSLYVDGSKHVISTDDHTVGELLGHAGIVMHNGDTVAPDADTAIRGEQFNINVYRARPVLVVDGTQTRIVLSSSQSPRALAEKSGFKIYPEDEFQLNVVTNFVNAGTIGEQVTVKRATPLTVHYDGKVKEIRTQAKRIDDALKRAGIVVGPNDTVSAPLSSAITYGLDLTIVRVSEVITTETATLPRSTTSTTDPNAPKGQIRVVSEGSDGSKTVTYRIHYRDGSETSREVIKLVSQTDPVARVQIVGTKEFFSGSVEYWRSEVVAAATQWGIDPNMMLRIMDCESHGNANAVNRATVNGEHATGLFQYLPSTWRSAGGTNENILDGSAQIQITAKKMALYGTSPWACR